MTWSSRGDVPPKYSGKSTANGTACPKIIAVGKNIIHNLSHSLDEAGVLDVVRARETLRLLLHFILIHKHRNNMQDKESKNGRKTTRV